MQTFKITTPHALLLVRPLREIKRPRCSTDHLVEVELCEAVGSESGQNN